MITGRETQLSNKKETGVFNFSGVRHSRVGLREHKDATQADDLTTQCSKQESIATRNRAIIT